MSKKNLSRELKEHEFYLSKKDLEKALKTGDSKKIFEVPFILKTYSNPVRLVIMSSIIHLHQKKEKITISSLYEEANSRVIGRVGVRIKGEKTKAKKGFDLRTIRHHLEYLEFMGMIEMEKMKKEKGQPVIIKPTDKLKPFSIVYGDEKYKIL